ncbi:hypothetical protein EV424DRAFT_1592066 [Suillus variegatus]|nr:hypothetical protein EV424DRAFT_1592066 [Suillus variegatus]
MTADLKPYLLNGVTTFQFMTETSVGTLLNEDAMTAAETEVPTAFDTVPILYVTLQQAYVSSSHSPSRSVPTPVQTPQSVSSHLSESAPVTSSTVSAVADSLSSSFTSTVSTGPTASSSIPTHISDNDEIDIGAFYAELGLDEPLATSQSPRIGGRTGKPELRSQMQTGLSMLKGRLAAIRSAAAAELAEAPDIRDAIENLVAKYIKGAEIYLRNLRAESRKNDKKTPLWERVVEKVGVKFSERLGVVEAVVNTWYSAILDQELREVYAVTAKVREVAEKAQVDLGLNYAWLDEVTYSDWQRYHFLIDVSEKFTEEANLIQNGTHENLIMDNLIVPIFEDLELEVQDVVIGFLTNTTA